MKRICCTAAALLIGGAAWSKEPVSPEGGEFGAPTTAGEVRDRSWTPAELALAAPLQLPAEGWDVRGLRLDLIYGASHSVAGVDLGVAGYAADDQWGLAVNALGCWGNGNFCGVGVAGLGNVSIGNAAGFEIASAINYVRGDFAGVQVAAVNASGSLAGVQAGAVNRNSGVCTGLQIGLWNNNLAESAVWGVGAVNIAARFSGLQAGIVNTVQESGRGVQVGLFNAAAKFSGLQIGLLNLIGNAPIAVLPVLNYAF